MARARTKEPLIDQPSEEVIDLADSRIADEAIAEFGDGEARAAAPRRSIFGVFSSLPFLLTSMVLSITVAGGLVFINTQRSERESRYIEQSSQLLMLSQRIAKDAREAVLGAPEAFKVLKESRDRFA